MSKAIRLIFIFSCLSSFSFGQLITVPVWKESETIASAREQDISLTLPFWDDFSDATTDYPKSDLWLYGKSAWVNNGMGINPPSLKVATLDGLDSLGKPYNINDILAKGFADKMISQPIRLDQVDPGLRSTVFISFYYQFQGNGEAPDPGDLLSLYFKNQSGTWERVWFVENTGNLAKDAFIQVLIPINADRFFHDKFQFRFQNFARLSGPYDTWNLDYIYLNKGRSSFDNSYPDRALATTLTSLLKEYRAVPVKHFLSNPQTSSPSFSAYNFRIGNNQPLNYFSNAVISTFKNKIETTDNLTLDVAQDIGSLIGLQRKTASLTTLPPTSAYDASADSIKIKLNLTLTTKDNILEGPDNGDYDPAKYSPIDFRKNDEMSSYFTLSNYYAYDDGTAEYGAGLNQPGAQLAYQYDMINNYKNVPIDDRDTLIVAFDIYFPRFGDETNQVIQLQVWRDLQGTGTVLHQQSITVSRSTQNRFTRIPLSNFIGVQKTFYIGWRQSSAAIIAVGLDKSADSGAKMFFNTNGVWEKNTTVMGNLMIRPVFGKGKGVVNQVEDIKTLLPFPNPTHRSFYLPNTAKNITVTDMQGRLISVSIEANDTYQQVSFTHPQAGIYIVRYIVDQSPITTKLMVREP